MLVFTKDVFCGQVLVDVARNGIENEFHKIHESRRLDLLEYGTNGRYSEILYRWNKEKRMTLLLCPNMTLLVHYAIWNSIFGSVSLSMK